MVGTLAKVGITVVVALAVFFQLVLKDKIWLGLGIGRTLEPLSSFPYACHKISDPRLEACEDMYLSESTRQLFLACSDPLARSQWMPNMGDLNLSGRSQKDAVVALDVDSPIKSPRFHELKTSEYTGTNGDGLINLVGMTGLEFPEENRVYLYFTNARPAVDGQTGNIADQYAAGANTTIELFEAGPHATEIKHIYTYANSHIATPNGITAFRDRSFYATNDHGLSKVGLRLHLAPLLKSGNVIFCKHPGECKTVVLGLNFPNGLTQGKDGLIYVPDSLTGIIKVFKIIADDELEQVSEIDTGYSIDNLSVDSNGDVWVAAFPIGLDIMKAYKDPYNAHPPSAALRIRKVEGAKYEVDKVIEDAEGEVLPVSTTVIHDAKTGRLFFSSVISPFIAICERN